jgi:hypothetical protein
MAYICILQLFPRSVRRYCPFGQFNSLPAPSCTPASCGPLLSGRIAVVTGGNSGVGSVNHKSGCGACAGATHALSSFAIAQMLSSAGATVVLACRRAREGDEAARRISSITSRRVVSLKCDLESLASVNEVQPQRCSTGTHQVSRDPLLSVRGVVHEAQPPSPSSFLQCGSDVVTFSIPRALRQRLRKAIRIQSSWSFPSREQAPRCDAGLQHK